MDGVIVLETLEFAPSLWITVLKILCGGCLSLSSIIVILFACCFFDSSSEFLVHEIIVTIGIILVGLLFLVGAIWIWTTNDYPVRGSYPREVVKVDESVDINEFYQNYNVFEYNEDGTFTVQEK